MKSRATELRNVTHVLGEVNLGASSEKQARWLRLGWESDGVLTINHKGREIAIDGATLHAVFSEVVVRRSSWFTKTVSRCLSLCFRQLTVLPARFCWEERECCELAMARF